MKKKIANPITPVKTEAISIQGHLFKLGDGLYPQWNLRFFVVQNGFIKYYKHGKDISPVAATPLKLCSVKPKQMDRRFCFEVISPERT